MPVAPSCVAYCTDTGYGRASDNVTVNTASTVAPGSSSITVAPAIAIAGGGNSLATVMATVSASLSAPPEPLLPRSLLSMVTDAAPAKPAAGSKRRPSRAALTAAGLPVKVIDPSAVPSPAVKDTPAVVASVNTPWV